MQKKMVFVLFILVSGFLFWPGFTNNVTAIVVGDYFVCNFEDYALGTKWINETVNGEKWLGIEPGNNNIGVGNSHTGCANSKFYKLCTYNVGGIYDAYFNLSKNTDFISYDLITSSSNSGEWTVEQYFRRNDDQQVLRIKTLDGSGAANDHDFYVYDDDNTQVASDTTSDSGCSHQINITFNTTAQEINVEIGNTTIDVWFASATFDYISTIYFNGIDTGGNLRDLSIDDFRIAGDDTDLPLLWELGNNDYGCVVCEYDGNMSHSFGDSDTFVDEVDFKTFPKGNIIWQVALAVTASSGYIHTESWLRIGDEYNKNRTTSYTYGSDYIIFVWEYVNITWFNSTVPFEFKFISSNGDADIALYYMHTDNDGDGDIQFKYSEDGDNFNGIYDGDTTLGRDLCYQFWYGPSYVAGDVNISVFNESNVSEAVTNWSIVITNKVTGSVEYVANNQNNVLTVNITDIGLGERLFYIEAEGYHSRVYYADIYPYVNYTLIAYLPPINESQVYCFRVVEASNEYFVYPIEDARIDISRLINGSYVNLTTLFTDNNGYAFAALIPGYTHYFNISKDGYDPEFTSFIVAASQTDCYEFRLDTIITGGPGWDKWYENISLIARMVSGGYLQDGNITVNYTDHNGSTINTDTYIFENHNNVLTFKNYSHDTNNTFNLKFWNMNTSRQHLVYFYYNNTASFIDQSSPVVIVLDPVHVYRDDRTPFSFDDRVTNLIGPLIINGVNIGWHVAVSVILGIVVLLLFNPFHTGVAIIGCGMAIGFTNGMFSLWFIDTFPVLLLTLCPLFVAIGVVHIKMTGGLQL